MYVIKRGIKCQKLPKKEENTFLMLFNRSGYVLNFSTAEFDVFTISSIGIALCNI